MKVLLREDVRGVGKHGDIVNVSDGFARNALIPQGKALVAGSGVQRQAAQMQKARSARDAQDKAKAEEFATQMTTALRISAKASSEGKLFGSITAGDIAREIESTWGAPVDRRDVALPEAIRSVGTFQAKAQLHPEVVVEVVIEVVASE